MRHLAIHLYAAFSCALLAIGCSGAPATEGEIVSPRIASSSPLDTRIAVLTVPAPASFVLDGDLREWPPLLPPRGGYGPVPPENRRGDHPFPPDANPGENPDGAPSRVAVALGDDVMRIAAELSPAVADGVWLGVGARVADVVPVGVPKMSRTTHLFHCEHEAVELSLGNYARGAPLAPEAAAACREKLAVHDAFLAAHRARFTRRFRLGRDGILAWDGGRADPIAGAAWKVGARKGGGIVVEATLPLTAMPRLAEAPLRNLRMVAGPAAAPWPDHDDRAPWVWVVVPERPLTHQDMLREAAFDALDRQTFYPTGASHQPGEPDEIETIRYVAGRRDGVERDVRRFYEEKGVISGTRVGVLHALGDWLVVSKPGAPPKILVADLLLAPMDLVRPPELRGVVQRGNALHAFFVMPRRPSGGWGSEGIGWTVMAVHASGTVSRGLVDQSGEPPRWTDVTCTANADFTKLVASGPSRWPDGRPELPVEVRVELTWDAETGAYRTTRRTPTLSTDRVRR